MKSIPADEFINKLDPQISQIINFFRENILIKFPELTEGLKWNAPSYSYKDNDIITFNLKNYDSVTLIFHTGPKGKDTKTGKHLFNDFSSDIEWLADKRFIIRNIDIILLTNKKEIIVQLIRKWIDFASNNFEYAD